MKKHFLQHLLTDISRCFCNQSYVELNIQSFNTNMLADLSELCWYDKLIDWLIDLKYSQQYHSHVEVIRFFPDVNNPFILTGPSLPWLFKVFLLFLGPPLGFQPRIPVQA